MFLSDLSIKRPVMICMALIALVLFGALAFRDLGIDLYPNVEFPVVTVISTLPATDPETMERLVTDPIEEAVSTLSSIKNVRSVSGEGVSHVMVEFELEKEIDVAYQEVQAKLEALKLHLPSDIQGPVIEKFDVSSLPVMTLLVSADLPPDALTALADKEIKRSLKRLPKVGQIKISGGQQAKVWLWLDRDKMQARRISIDDVQHALQTQHVEAMAGKISENDKDWLLKTKAEYADLSEIERMVISEDEGKIVRFRDIGQAQRGLSDKKALARMNGTPAVALLVGKQSGANTVEVAQRLKNKIAELRESLASRGATIEIAQDNSLYIKRSVEEMHFHLLFGGGLAILIVFIFLRNLRSTFVCALALPTAVIGTFAFMGWMGFTQNMMTLLALSIAIGLLIDDAIVVQENIMRHVEMGLPPKEASALGTREIALAVLATTLSVVAVFVPVAFMKGIVGLFFYEFGLTVSFAVLISMLVSFTLNPLFSARMLRQPKAGRLYALLENIFSSIERVYESVLRFGLGHKKTVAVLALASFISAILVAKFLKFEFLPPEDQGEFTIAVELEEGASFAKTAWIVQQIEEKVQGFPWVDYLFSRVGEDDFHGSNRGSLYVKMRDKKMRTATQFEAMEQARDLFKVKPEDAKITVEEVQKMSGGGERMADVQFEIRGSSLAVLQELAGRCVAALEKRGGYIDLSTSSCAGKPQASLRIKREEAGEAGISALSIAMTLKAAIGGVDVIKMRENDDDRIDICLRLQECFRDDLSQVAQIHLRNARGDLIPISRLIDLQREKGPSRIDRCNQTRQVTVYANLQRSEKVLGEAIQEIEQVLASLDMPPGYTWALSGNAESFKESFSHLVFALALAVVFVYMVLAAQFESLLQPLTIMLSLPLSIIGAIGALVICNMTMSIFTMIGIIMLMGLVTKNGILLIDFIQHLKDRVSMEEAILMAGKKRLRPILMTSLAVIFGMLPVAIGQEDGSESRSPMAVAVIGGLITSTLLTLVVIPVSYALLEKLKARLRGKNAGHEVKIINDSEILINS